MAIKFDQFAFSGWCCLTFLVIVLTQFTHVSPDVFCVISITPCSAFLHVLSLWQKEQEWMEDLKPATRCAVVTSCNKPQAEHLRLRSTGVMM